MGNRWSLYREAILTGAAVSPNTVPSPLFLIVYLFAFPFLLIGFWWLVCRLLSLLGGWHALGRVYRMADYRGETKEFQSGRLGFVNYRRVLTVGANSEGFFLDVFGIFRPGHPSLFIPWHDVQGTRSRFLGRERIDLHFGAVHGVRLRLPAKVAGYLLNAAPEPLRAPLTGSGPSEHRSD